MNRKIFIFFALPLILFTMCWLMLPFPRQRLQRYPTTCVILDRYGAPMRVQLAEMGMDSRPSYEASFEDWICMALIAAEDKRFESHCGLDFLALLRASGQNLSSASIISGASTISTQVIRLAWPDVDKRGVGIKLKEAFRALQMERLYSKKDIITQYLNRAPFGGNIVGIEAAAQRYFKKRAKDLSLAEASLLAGLPQSPSRFRPDRHLKAAQKRQHFVLSRMEACGMISHGQHLNALKEALLVQQVQYPFKAPHFCETILQLYPEQHGEIRSTLDPELQQLATQQLNKQLKQLDHVTGGAIVILEVKTGSVRALVGSPDYNDLENAGRINAALAKRSPGSTLKPFVYGLALENGLLTPERRLKDLPTQFGDYTPVNFDGRFSGLVTMRHALVHSLNLPALHTTEELGVQRLYQHLSKMGFEFQKPASHYGLGLALGNAEVSLLDLTQAYACLARNGTSLPLRWLEQDNNVSPRTIYSPATTWLLSDILSGSERALQVSGHIAAVELPRMAWKTGTSSDFRDAWTIGYTPEYVVGVWLGNLDGSPAPELTGTTAAAPVVWEIMRQIYPSQSSPWFKRPASLIQRMICSESGMLQGPLCSHTEPDWFIERISTLNPCRGHCDSLAARSAPAPLSILSPVSRSTFRIFSGQRPELALKANQAEEMVYWFINQQFIGAAERGEPFFWSPSPGTHQITCATPQGQYAHSMIEVK